jgi:uncharacterized protein YjbI with pentapeptide repeats
MKLDRRYIRFSFVGENLAGAELSGMFVNVDFTRANLTGARLSGTFVNVTFDGADLTDAEIWDGRFINTNLDRAICTVRSVHQEPMTEHRAIQSKELILV